VCGIGLFSYLNYVSPFLKRKSWRVISIDVSTKHHVIKAERAQTKSGDGAIGYRRKLPSVEITLPRDMFVSSVANWRFVPGFCTGGCKMSSAHVKTKVWLNTVLNWFQFTRWH